MSEDEGQRAREAAFRLLAVRARSAQELRQRLKRKGFPQEIVDQVIADLQAKGYQNDAEFARQFAREKWSGSGWGPARISQELRAKGISPGLVSTVVEETFGEVDLVAAILPRAGKRWENMRDLPRETRRRRLSGFLRRRGYDWETLGKVIVQLENDEIP
ncbi:MAG: regulatory protein RecX [Candidatus Neomarinimicrobiota bacterium]